MATVIVMTIYMLLYTTPILGILTVFVTYELLRRSCAGGLNRTVSLVKQTPSQPKKDKEMARMNPAKVLSLEEEIINKNSPIGKGGFAEAYIESIFKPVHDKILGGGSLI
jgi:hypothetical protein